MRYPYLELPDEARRIPRPVVPVRLEDLEEAPLFCLLDSGAVSNRLPAGIASPAGLSLEDSLAVDKIGIGGLTTTGCLLRVDLTVGSITIDTPVWFCDPWPWSFGLLGQEGFFRYFRITFCAAAGWLELSLETNVN